MSDRSNKLQLDIEDTLQPVNLQDPITLEYAQQFAYTRPANVVLKAFNVDPESGLHADEVAKRQTTYGPNELNDESGVSYLQIFARQVLNAMTMVLLIAFVVSMSIKSWIEGGVIGFVVALNIAIGFFQEAAAEKTMASLRALASPTAHVVRAGELVTVPSTELVPGDIVELASGDQVPADLRLFEASNLEADEALLTGEAMPVTKRPKEVLYDPDTPVGDRINLAFMSSTITKGRGTGVVVTTGMQTEIGLLAGALQGPSKRSKLRQIKEASYGKKVQTAARVGVGALWDKVAAFLGLTGGTPLQRKLSVLAIALFLIAVIFAIICFAANNWTDNEVILYAVATGVAMIPASLPAVLAITMAKGAQAMTTRGVIVRKASAIEALGAVTDICSDKTGTLTQGRMIVKQVWLPAEGVISVADSEDVFDPQSGRVSMHPEIQPKDLDLAKTPHGSRNLPLDQEFRVSNQTKNSPLTDFLNVVSLCNNAKVLQDKETNKWVAHGDFTECALQTFAHRFGWGKPTLTRTAAEDNEENKEDPAEWELVHENGFSSDVKRMSVVCHHHPSGRGLVMMKGAVERVLEACVSFSGPNGIVELDDQIRSEIMANVDVLASQGLRVLAQASRPVAVGEPSTVLSEGETAWHQTERPEVERNMTFVGLSGIYDPPRPSSAPAIAKCHGAGIEVHMLTGDHLGTARAIAQEIHILPSDTDMLTWSEDRRRAMVMTGPQVDKMSEEELDALPDLPLVVARCSPQTKVRMIEALHRRSTRCVVMTGDGVNDAPSLKMADIGIAMGSGSDVAIGVADLVLSDDNFASIVAGIEEGRRTFDNIKKFVLHLLAQNVAQALTLLIALAFKDSYDISVFPLAPVEILWVIMVASGLPAMALGFEPAAEDVMDRPPHNIKTGIFTLEVVLDLLVYGVWIGALCLSTFALCVWGFGPGTLADSWNCNKPTSTHDRGFCRPIFRARGTTWAVMVICSLLLAWEMVHSRRSFFRMRNERSIWTQWWFDTWGRNKLLFATVVGGAVAIPPILYIPVISEKVFLHSGISWEWGVVAVTSLMFMLGVEAWKGAKRVYLRRRTAKSPTQARPVVETPTSDEKSIA